MKKILTAFSILALAIACNNKSPEQEKAQKMDEAQKDYREDVNEAQQDKQEDIRDAQEDYRDEKSDQLEEQRMEDDGSNAEIQNKNMMNTEDVEN